MKKILISSFTLFSIILNGQSSNFDWRTTDAQKNYNMFIQTGNPPVKLNYDVVSPYWYNAANNKPNRTRL